MRSKPQPLPFLTALLLLCWPAAGLAQSGDRADQDPFREDLASAGRQFLKGEYGKARALYDEILAAWEEEPEGSEDRPGLDVVREARERLLQLGLIVGEYRQVIDSLEKLPVAEQGLPGMRIVRARALYRVGEYEQAAAQLQPLVDSGTGPFEAYYRLGRAQRAAGAVDAATATFRAAVTRADRESVRDALDITYIARCLIELGGEANFVRASGLLVEAIRLAPERPEARTTYGELLFLAYREHADYPNAEAPLEKVLENNGDVEAALLALYRSRSYNMFLDGSETIDYLARCLNLNPRAVPAMILRAERMIDDRQFEAGARQLDQALAIDPRNREALSHRCAVAILQGEEAEAAALRARAEKGHPAYAEIDRIIGDHMTALYRFADAIPYFERSLARAEDHVPAMHGLAKALLYTGAGGKAAKVLERAEALEKGFADAWRNNILLSEKRLGRDYEAVTTDNFVLLMHRDDRPVLEGYLTRWFEEAHAVLGAKYRYEPTTKVRVEVLHEWVDFSVRTIGFRGFSALGACFGDFITMVSPVDDLLRRNDFMWSATAWHEYVHVISLALSKHRVPRWLTEGLSVYEETQKDPAWERGMLRDLFDAYHNEDLPPVRLLNRLFRGNRILFGYYQGGLIVEYIAAKHGFDAVLDMLRMFGEDQALEKIFEETLGIDTREFDQRFRAWVRDEKLRDLKLVPRYDARAIGRLLGRVQDHPGDLEARIALAWAYLQKAGFDSNGRLHGPVVEAGIQVGAVLRAEPEHPVGLLMNGELLRLRRQDDAAIAAYEKGFAAGADDFLSRLHLGELYERKQQYVEALSQYHAAKACWPRCTDQELAPVLKIARVLEKQGKRTEAMMERKVFCRTTARAFAPRLALADFEKEQGNRDAEVAWLAQLVQIDPFMRSLHERLGDAYVALGRGAEGVQEYEVGLAVPTALDRSHLETPPAERPAADSEPERFARAGLCLKLARTCQALGRGEAAMAWLDRAEKEAPASDFSDEAAGLRAEWIR